MQSLVAKTAEPVGPAKGARGVCNDARGAAPVGGGACIPHMHVCVCVCVCVCGWNEVFLCVCVLMYVCVYGRRLNTQCGLQGESARPQPWRNVLCATETLFSL
jgi:hypothetical protein